MEIRQTSFGNMAPTSAEKRTRKRGHFEREIYNGKRENETWNFERARFDLVEDLLNIRHFQRKNSPANEWQTQIEKSDIIGIILFTINAP